MNEKKWAVPGKLPISLKKQQTSQTKAPDDFAVGGYWIGVVMILPQVHLRKPCYDFTFL